jgi:hypothetical protein
MQGALQSGMIGGRFPCKTRKVTRTAIASHFRAGPLWSKMRVSSNQQVLLSANPGTGWAENVPSVPRCPTLIPVDSVVAAPGLRFGLPETGRTKIDQEQCDVYAGGHPGCT